MRPIRILDPDFRILTEIDLHGTFERTNRWHSAGEFQLNVNHHTQGTRHLQKDNMIVMMEETTVETSMYQEENLSEGIHHNVEVSV